MSLHPQKPSSNPTLPVVAAATVCNTTHRQKSIAINGEWGRHVALEPWSVTVRDHHPAVGDET